MTTEIKYYSASKLAKKLGVEYSVLVKALINQQYAIRGNEGKLVLTELGLSVGAKLESSEKYGQYISWPENIELELPSFQNGQPPQTCHAGTTSIRKQNATSGISATKVGEFYGLNSQFINDIACILGWAKRAPLGSGNGYEVTALGIKNGMTQRYSSKFNVTFLLFPTAIYGEPHFQSCVEIFKHLEATQIQLYTGTVDYVQTVAVDGHLAQSIYHCIIDNWLLFNGICHVTNSREPLPYGDFYLPTIGLCIIFDMAGQTATTPLVEDKGVATITFNPLNIRTIDSAMRQAMFTVR
ncbi:hypothetical protein [Photobacterium damselae]|uniref:hypothetical protein n=1 Tax=Photobacterium damselae TaxID=38293 RepID=UPI000D669342|nr:hypothetical protein [Photobacterium damselae]AWK84697.1 hypothetical protein BST98_21980 [Photobacterium damselae]